jgi:biopolymer transport protein ExbD
MANPSPLRAAPTWAAGFLVAILAGCSADGGPAAPATKPSPGTVVVEIGPGVDDDVWVEGWKMAERDLPDFVGRRHPTAVIIRGNVGSKYERAVRIEAELKQIGVDNVTIAPITQ